MSQPPFSVKPGTPIELDKFDPRFSSGFDDKGPAITETQANVMALDDLSFRLYAENQRSVLVVLQGMDASGKDGTLRNVMTGMDPQSCIITSFKRPSVEELDHDFLWRIHKAAPRRGTVGVFNRSHYEDVLVVRVRKLVPRELWQSRYERINEFERNLVEEGTTIVKFFLHISKDEQRERLQARLDDPTKRWKFDKQDLDERLLWDEYQRAYEDALTKCNTMHAPWFVVPADRKWHRNLVVSRILRQTLEQMAPEFPPPVENLDDLNVE